jgi:hypothetical protein
MAGKESKGGRTSTRSQPKLKPKPRLKPAPRNDTSERLLAQLDEKIRQLALVNGVLRTAVGAATIGEILGVFASNLKESVPFDRMSVALCNPERRVFHVPFIYFGGRVQENLEAPRPYADTPLTRVIETGQPLLRKNISAEMTFTRDHEFLKKGLTCEMIFPLLLGSVPFGTFQMSCFEPGRLTEKHLSIVSDLIPAIAIVTHRLIGKKA